MPKRRWRLRVSFLMATVAFIACGLAGDNMRRRAMEYSKLAGFYGEREEGYKTIEQSALALAIIHERNAKDDSTAPDAKLEIESGEASTVAGAAPSEVDEESSFRTTAKNVGTMANYWGMLRRKYAYASTHPWIHLDPDPLPPDPVYRVDYWIEHQQYAKAIEELDRAMLQDPTDSSPHVERAWLLATCPDPAFRDGRKAVESAILGRALAEHIDSFELSALAAAYAESANFKSAVKYQEQALHQVMLEAPDRLGAYQQRLDLYKAGKAYHETPGVNSARGD
jgi:tetratricopeptide (TPR) repeat protein